MIGNRYISRTWKLFGHKIEFSFSSKSWLVEKRKINDLMTRGRYEEVIAVCEYWDKDPQVGIDPELIRLQTFASFCMGE